MKPLVSERGACGPTPNPEAELASQCNHEEKTEASQRAPATVQARVLTEVSVSSSQPTNPAAVFPEPRLAMTRKARSTMCVRIRNHHGTRQSCQDLLLRGELDSPGRQHLDEAPLLRAAPV